jgi:hypothetical protein
MGRFEGRRHWLLFVALLVTTLVTVGVGALGLGVALVALLQSGLVASLSAAVPYVVGALVLGLLDATLLVWTVVAALRQLSLPRDDRLAAAAERAERTVPVVRSLDLAERFEPTDEQRREELRQRYVDGEITEAEFERRVREYVEDPSDLATEDPTLSRVLDEDETGSERSGSTDAGDRDRERGWATDTESETT